MPLVVDRYPLGAAQTNCYLVRAERSAKEAVVVDPGASASQLRLELASMGASCAGILITHCHWDHLGAVAELAEGTGAKVWFPEAEAQVIRQPDDFYPGMGVRPYEPDVLVAGGEQIDLAGIAFETVAVPGHSPGHVAYYADGCLFSGDVLFAGSVGRVDLPGGDWETLLASIRTLLDRSPPDTTVYSGHGPPTTLAAERTTNPFLAELRA